MIEFPCANCGKLLRGKDEYAGRHTKCPSCRQPLTVPSKSADQAPISRTAGVAPIDAPMAAGQDKNARTNMIIKYDRFKDMTSISTPEMPEGFNGVWVTTGAKFNGRDLSKAIPLYSLMVAVWTNGNLNDLFSGNELIMLADGMRIKLELVGPGEPVMLAIIDKVALHSLASAAVIEGQIDGHYEFKLTPAQISLIADFYQQVAEGSA